MNLPLLLADAGNILGVVLVIIVSIISVLGHLANGMKKQPPPVGRRPGNAGVPPQPNRELSDEIDAFLHKVLKGKEEEAPGPQRGTRPASSRPRKNRGGRDNAPIEAEIVPAGSASRATGRTQFSMDSTREGRALVDTGPDGGGVAQEAERLGQQASILGDSIDKSSSRAEERMHDAFDHNLGELGGESRPAEAGDAGGSTSQSDTAPQIKRETAQGNLAEEIRQWFGDPQDVRKAIVFSEILTPPSDRW